MSMQIGTAGSQNTAVGKGAMYYGSTGGNYNVALGYESGKNISSGDFNVVIGANTGANITTESYHTSLGRDSGPATAGLTNTISIGYNTKAEK